MYASYEDNIWQTYKQYIKSDQLEIFTFDWTCRCILTQSDVEIVLRGEEGAELSESEGDDDSELDNSAPSGESETEEVE